MAVVNALGPLVKTRHTLSSKIINAFLSVNVLAISNSPKSLLQFKSLLKTLRIHLTYFLKTNAAGPLASRIDQYLRRTVVNGAVSEGEDISRKRPAQDGPSQPSKRLKSEGETLVIDPAVSMAFLLDASNPLALYEAKLIALPYVVEIILKALEVLPSQLLEDRLNVPPTR
jgi:Symplekin/PTA1 N-terminal